MTYQSAVSVAATARAMGYENVAVFRNAWCWMVDVRLGMGMGGFMVVHENRTWRRRRLMYRGPRRVYNARLDRQEEAR